MDATEVETFTTEMSPLPPTPPENTKTKHKKAKHHDSRHLHPNGQPRRKCGVTETPNMDVVIGYNIFPEGYNSESGGIPRILLNSEPILDLNTIIESQAVPPAFDGVYECKKVIFRRVAGNNFFYELVKANAAHERIFLICDPTEGNKLENLSGRQVNILFLGRNGKEVIAIRITPNTKETVSVFYKGQEIGRIIRIGNFGNDGSEYSHSILDSQLRKIFMLQKSYQIITLPTTTCCLRKPKRKISDGFTALRVTPQDDNVAVSYSDAAKFTETEIKFFNSHEGTTQLSVGEKVLLFATFVSIKTKALDTQVGMGFRISLSFPPLTSKPSEKQIA